MENSIISANNVKITLAVITVFILVITLIIVNDSNSRSDSQQSLADLIGESSATNSTLATAPKLASVDSLLTGLVSRLKQQPEDIEGWILLASSYHHLHRIEEANQAFEQAVLLGFNGKPPYISKISNSHRSSSPAFSPVPKNSFLHQYLNNNKRVKQTPDSDNASHQKLATNVISSAEIEPKTVDLASER